MTPLILGLTMLASAGTKGELTLYRGGFALVREQRVLPLRRGLTDVRIEGVSPMIEANSVGVRRITANEKFEILQQDYRYDLVSVKAILTRAVGKRISIRRVLPGGRIQRVNGTLASAPTATVSDAEGEQKEVSNGMVVKLDNGRTLLDPVGTIEVDQMREGLISNPSLMWKVQSDRTGKAPIELSYLTRGIDWESAYTLMLDSTGTAGTLSEKATVSNYSGIGFNDVKLRLLAGEVNREDFFVPADFRGRMNALEMQNVPQLEQYADYHLYTIGHRTTIGNHEVKQFPMMEADGIKVTRRLTAFLDPQKEIDSLKADGDEAKSRAAFTPDHINATALLQIANTEANHLGTPLPAGVIRVFQRSRAGDVALLGQGGLADIPKDEPAEVEGGRVMEVGLERRMVSYKGGGRDHPLNFAVEYEIRFWNDSDRDETLALRQVILHQFNVIDLPHKNLSDSVIQSLIELPAHTEKTVRYTSTWKLN